MARSRSKSRRARQGARSARSATMVFSRHNYVLLLIGLALVVVGFVMMRLDNQVESFISLYLAPLMILGGYLEIIYAILWRPKPESAEA